MHRKQPGQSIIIACIKLSRVFFTQNPNRYVAYFLLYTAFFDVVASANGLNNRLAQFKHPRNISKCVTLLCQFLSKAELI